MTKEFFSRKSSSNFEPAASQFAPRPFASPQQSAPEVQAQTDNQKVQKVQQPSFGDRLARISITPPNPSIPRMQTKLTIGEPGEQYQREADTVARQVVNQINLPDTIQPQQTLKLQMKPMVQCLDGETAAPSDLEASIQKAQGSGQPLSDRIREPMEQELGADFSRVRVHADAQSDRLNQSIQAKAFTTAEDIFFRQGAYEPSSRGGQELIAHELTHVVQQNKGVVIRSLLPPELLLQDSTNEISSSSEGDRTIESQLTHTAQKGVPTLKPQIQQEPSPSVNGTNTEPESEKLAVESQAIAMTEPKSESSESAASNEVQFQVGEETHRLWIEQVDGHAVVMVASEPITVPQQLQQWSKEAKKMPSSSLKSNILEWIDKCWQKAEELKIASEEEDRSNRANKIHDASANLKEMMKRLFWAFQMDLPELGAVAVYRSIHFTKDWKDKRGRTIEAESERSFESVREEGSYSSATWELAKGIAGSTPISKTHLESANRIVMKVLEKWKQTTDYTREDNSKVGAEKVKSREGWRKGIKKFMSANPVKAQELQQLLDEQKEGFSHSGFKYENQFMAALSRYIDNQNLFELELKGEKESAYKDVPFESIPFISTSKDASEAVKYAKGKLTKEENRSTKGVVGRVLVYIAHRVDMLEAGGIDVWQKLGEGKLKFTEWRMNENEITFASKIPDYFLRAMTSVTGEASVSENANLAEMAAAKAAVPFGGLKPLPKNKSHK